MEPIAARANLAALVRPLPGPELTAVLRQGQVVAGEVLQTLGGGTVLIGLGRHRVPAQSDVPLERGHHYLFRAELAGGETVLRVLSSAAPEESAWLRALRSVLGQERPLGDVLTELAAALRSEARADARTDATSILARALAGHAFRPGASGAELRAALSLVGLGYEAALAALGDRVSGAARARLRGDLKARLLSAAAELEQHPGGARRAVERALAGLEAEQLLNVVRREAGSLYWSLPFPVRDGWTTVHFLFDDRFDGGFDGGDPRGRRGPAEAPERDAPLRLSIGLTLPVGGEMRADLRLGTNELDVRIGLERAELVQRVRADAAALAERLAEPPLRVQLSVTSLAPAEPTVEAEAHELSGLGSGHLMDVEG